MWRTFITRVLPAILVLLLACYVADWIVLRFRVHSGSALGSVLVHRYYAIPQKGGKLEFMPADTEEVTCVNALFPHMDDPPCWYLVRHADQRIDM
ncbi:MAG TPA: hypothetical protein VFQ00_01825 [Terriglobales bacterium]|nr:hypothetical protein [Terriglobales bacterium]